MRGVEQKMYKEQESLAKKTHKEIEDRYIDYYSQLESYGAIFFPVRVSADDTSCGWTTHTHSHTSTDNTERDLLLDLKVTQHLNPQPVLLKANRKIVLSEGSKGKSKTFCSDFLPHCLHLFDACEERIRHQAFGNVTIFSPSNRNHARNVCTVQS